MGWQHTLKSNSNSVTLKSWTKNHAVWNRVLQFIKQILITHIKDPVDLKICCKISVHSELKRVKNICFILNRWLKWVSSFCFTAVLIACSFNYEVLKQNFFFFFKWMKISDFRTALHFTSRVTKQHPERTVKKKKTNNSWDT